MSNEGPMSSVTEVEIRSGIAMLWMNRPEAMNALTIELAEQIVAQLKALDADEAVEAVVITGRGDRAFCAGLDLKEARDMEVADIASRFGRVCAVYRQILMTEKPVVAAINGVAAGGGFQIALVSDQRVAHRSAKMGQPEINAGIPSVMGSYWMDLHLGLSKNQELSMTGRLITAEEAAALGLVNKLVEKEEVLSAARDLARSLADKPKAAWKYTKARFRTRALDGFDDAFRLAVLGQQEAYAKGEPQAIMEAFAKGKSKRGG
jgi:enoyl-CoA hydratase